MRSFYQLKVAYLLLMSTLASHVSVTCSIALFQSPILAQDHHDSFISYMTDEKEEVLVAISPMTTMYPSHHEGYLSSY